MNPYAHLGQFSFARPVFQPTAPLRRFMPSSPPATQIPAITNFDRRRAMPTEPAGQWTFEIRFTRGRDVASPCGPVLLTTAQARETAQQLLHVIGFGSVLSGTLADICGIQKIQDLQREWARLPNGSTVSINASRSGVFRFTMGPATKGQSLEDFFRQMREQVFSVSGPPEEQDDGTLGQENGNGETMTPDGRTITIRSRGFFPSPFQFAPAPFAYSPFFAAPSFYTFQVMAEQPVTTDQRTLNSWAEALAHAERLYTATPGASRVIVTDQNGQRQVFPGAFPRTPFYGAQPFARRGTLVPFSVTRAVTLAGPYGHLGQGPGFELASGLQQFSTAVAQSIATNLAAMYWEPMVATRNYRAHSPAHYQEQSGSAPPSVGYPPEASEPGAIILVNPASIVPADALSTGLPLDQVDVIVAGDRATALTFAAPGSNYGVVFPLQPMQVAKTGISPAAIAAGIAAAAVAALLLFA